MPSIWNTGPTVSTTKATVTGLAPATSYDFQIVVVNAFGSVVSAPITVTTAASSTTSAFSTDYSAAFGSGATATMSRLFRFLFRGRNA